MSIAEKLTQIAENEQRVYDAGFAAGQEAGGGGGYDEGVEAGKQAEHDRFWDSYLYNGNRTDCAGLFMGDGWNNETLKPNHGLTVKVGYMMFANCGYSGDLDDIFDNRGLPLVWDLNGSATQGYYFYNTKISAIGTVDLSPITTTAGVASAFNSTSIITIRNFIPPKVAMTNTCFGANIENLGIGGEITRDMNLSRCSKLTDASVDSVFDNLADLTGQTRRTITFHSNVIKRITQTPSLAERLVEAEEKNWDIM